MRSPFILIAIILVICAACVATIFWALDPTDFYALDDKFDISDAVLSCVIIFLIANIPSEKLH